MTMDERFFGYLTVFLMSVAGLGVTLAGDGARPGLVTKPKLPGRATSLVLEEYAALATLDVAALTARRRQRDVTAALASVSPETAMADWVGLVLHDVSGRGGTVDEHLARLRTRETEEGVPAHFVIGSDGAVVATRRWSRQRPWRQTGLEDDQRWIVVHSLAGADPPGRGGLLLEGLRLSSVSKGGLAVVAADGSVSVVAAPKR